MPDPVANFAFSTVATAPSPATSGTSVTLTDATNFPDPASVGAYNVTINAAGATRAQIASGAEIVRVTAKSTNTLTIVRATEGPNSARSVVVGDEVALTITAKTVTDLGTVVIFDSILGSAAASIDTGAGAIPAGFKAIEVLYRVRTADAATVAVTFLRVNNDTSAIYDQGGLQFNGVGPAVFGNYAQTGWWTISVGATGTAHRFNAGSIVFPSYDDTTDWKVGIQSEATIGTPANGDMRSINASCTYRSTSAISRFAVVGNGVNVSAGSRLTVLGRR